MEFRASGQNGKNILLKHFGSVKKIREASAAELQEAGLPAAVAETVRSSIFGMRHCVKRIM